MDESIDEFLYRSILSSAESAIPNPDRKRRVIADPMSRRHKVAGGRRFYNFGGVYAKNAYFPILDAGFKKYCNVYRLIVRIRRGCRSAASISDLAPCIMR